MSLILPNAADGPPASVPPVNLGAVGRRAQAVRRFLATKFAQGMMVYFGGNILNAILPMLLVPVLTRYLTPTDYGLISTSTVVVQIFTVLLGWNAFGLIARSHFDQDLPAQRRLVSTSILAAVSLGLLLVLLVLPVRPLLESFTKFPAAWFPALVLIAVLSVIQTTYLGLVQARGEPRRYVWLQFLSSALNLGLSVFFVVSFAMDWRGRMLAILASGVTLAAISACNLGRRLGLLRLDFDWQSLRALKSFGFPLIPHFIGGWVMMMVARLYLNNLATVADNGLFSVGFNLASPMAMAIGSVQQAYWPALFSKLNQKGFDRVGLARPLLLVAVALPVLSVAYGLAMYWALPLFVGPRFYGAAPYVLWLALAFSLQGVYFIFASFVIYTKRTALMGWRTDFLGGVTLLVACPIFIRVMGPVGAAQATALGFAVSTIGCITACRTAYPMPWRIAARSFIGGSRNVPDSSADRS